MMHADRLNEIRTASYFLLKDSGDDGKRAYDHRTELLAEVDQLRADLAGVSAIVADLKAQRDTAERDAVAAHAEATALRKELADMTSMRDASLSSADKMCSDAGTNRIAQLEAERKLAIAVEALRHYADTPVSGVAERALAAIEAPAKADEGALVVGQRYRLGDLPAGAMACDGTWSFRVEKHLDQERTRVLFDGAYCDVYSSREIVLVAVPGSVKPSAETSALADNTPTGSGNGEFESTPGATIPPAATEGRDDSYDVEVAADRLDDGERSSASADVVRRLLAWTKRLTRERDDWFGANKLARERVAELEQVIGRHIMRADTAERTTANHERELDEVYERIDEMRTECHQLRAQLGDLATVRSNIETQRDMAELENDQLRAQLAVVREEVTLYDDTNKSASEVMSIIRRTLDTTDAKGAK